MNTTAAAAKSVTISDPICNHCARTMFRMQTGWVCPVVKVWGGHLYPPRDLLSE